MVSVVRYTAVLLTVHPVFCEEGFVWELGYLFLWHARYSLCGRRRLSLPLTARVILKHACYTVQDYTVDMQNVLSCVVLKVSRMSASSRRRGQ